MRPPFVVDASVAAKWFLNEEFAEPARRLRAFQSDLHVPRFFLLEFGHVICKKLRRAEIDRADAIRMIETVLQLPIQRHDDEVLLANALQFAFETHSGLYDSLYLSLAVHLSCAFVTADRRFMKKVAGSRFADHALWIEDLPAT